MTVSSFCSTQILSHLVYSGCTIRGECLNRFLVRKSKKSRGGGGENNHLPLCTNTQTNTGASKYQSRQQTKTNRHTLLNTHGAPHPCIENPLSKWATVVNNKHTDCLEAIKRPRWAFSSPLERCNISVPLKGVGVAHYIVCYHRGVIQGKQISEHLNKSTPRTSAPKGFLLLLWFLIEDPGREATSEQSCRPSLTLNGHGDLSDWWPPRVLLAKQ